MLKIYSKSRKKSTAQAMVEFALALPVLLLVMYGLIETGRLLFIYVSVVTAARQAVRYGSATGDNGSGTLYFNDCPGIIAAAKNVGFINPINISTSDITYDDGLDSSGNPLPFSGNGYPACPPQPTVTIKNGDRIRVQVSSVYKPIVPVPFVPFTGFTITSNSNRTLLVGISITVPTPGGGGGPTGSLTLTKTASPMTYTHVGQTITYTYTLTGSNPPPDPPYSIVDDKVGPVCTDNSLPLNCSATYTIVQADLDNGSVTNTATATSTSAPASQASATVNFLGQPALTLTKTGTAPSVIAVGNKITYDFKLTNSGNVVLLAPYTILDSNKDTIWDCSSAVSPLAVGAVTDCSGTYTLLAADLTNGSVNNTATATAKFGSTTVTSNSSSTTVQIPSLALTLTVSPLTVSSLGVTVTYTYTVSNNTGSSVTAIKVSDSRGASNLACLASLSNGGSGFCIRTYNAYSQADMNAGFFLNVATASGTSGGNTINSNQSNAQVTVTQNPSLALTKSASPTHPTSPATTFPVGQVINYSYTITNNGNVTLTASTAKPITVVDDKLGTVCTITTGTLAPNGTQPCSKAYSLVQADLDAGSIINHATASATFNSTVITSPSTSATVTVITYTPPRFKLVKTSDPTSYAAKGDDITYIYTLVNTGGVPLTAPYTASDDQLGTVNCSGALSPLPVGFSTACTNLTYSVKQKDVHDGSITNTVSGITAKNGAATVTSVPLTSSLTVSLLNCTTSTLTHGSLTQSSGNLVTWLINNNAGALIHISSIAISWSNGGISSLTQVSLGATTLWGPSSNSSGSLIVPGGPWVLPTGTSGMSLQYTSGTGPSNVRIVLDFSETTCPVLDSAN